MEVARRTGGGFIIKIAEKKAPDRKEEVAVPAPEWQEESYRASQEFERELERLFPLYVERELKAAVEDLEKFGLQKDFRRLELQFGDRKAAFALGAQTYGGATQYLRQLPDGAVYLVSTALERTFDVRAPRYLERRLVGVERNDIESVLVTDPTGGKARRFLRQKRENTDVWVNENQPDVPNTLAGTWMNKVLLLGAEAYLAAEPQPAPEAKARLVFRSTSLKEEELALYSSKDEKGQEVFFARSPFTGQWVKVSPTNAREVISDLSAVLGQ